MRARVKRRLVLLAAALALGLGLLCVDFAPPRPLLLRDGSGAPVPDAWIAYHHHRDRFNFVDSLGWVTPGGLLRSDAGGTVRIPARLGLKPPLDSRSRIRLDLVYAPRLHYARGPVVPEGEVVLVLDDLAADPELWERALDRLYSAVRFQFWPPDTAGDGRDRRNVRVAPEELDPLVEAVGVEYGAFLAQHADTPRAPPDAEQMRGWTPEQHARMQEDLAQRPLWGQHMAQRWQRDIERLEKAWAARRNEG